MVRAFDENNKPIFDVLCLTDEPALDKGPIKAFDRHKGTEHTAPKTEVIS